MADVCEKHSIRLLTYGTVVRLCLPRPCIAFRLNLSPPSLHLPRLVRWFSGRCLARQARARSVLERSNPITAQGEFKRALSVFSCPLRTPNIPPFLFPSRRPFFLFPLSACHLPIAPFSLLGCVKPVSTSTPSLEYGATGPSSSDFSPYYEESATATAARASPTSPSDGFWTTHSSVPSS